MEAESAWPRRDHIHIRNHHVRLAILHQPNQPTSRPQGHRARSWRPSGG
nr:MAG TPA: hypothetical protein [Caudoviricetes sp.]